jgi:hypothetical protein
MDGPEFQVAKHPRLLMIGSLKSYIMELVSDVHVEIASLWGVSMLGRLD